MKSTRLNEDVVPVMVPGQVILRRKMKREVSRSLVDSLTEEEDSHNSGPLIPLTAQPLEDDGDEKEKNEIDIGDLPAAPHIRAPKSATTPVVPPKVPVESVMVLIFGPDALGATVSRLNESQVVVNYKNGRAKVFDVSEGGVRATAGGKVPAAPTPPPERAPLPPAPGDGLDYEASRRIKEAWAAQGIVPGAASSAAPVMESQMTTEQVIQGASERGVEMPAPKQGSIGNIMAKMRSLGVKVPSKE